MCKSGHAYGIFYYLSIPVIFGCLLYLAIFIFLDVFHRAPLRPPEYSVTVGVTGLILALMFPMSVFLKGKKDDMESNKNCVYLVQDTMLLGASKKLSDDDLLREEISVTVWRYFFNLVAVIPAIVSIALFLLWGGIRMLERGQYAEVVHLIATSLIMSTFYALYDMEWSETFRKVHIRHSLRKNEDLFTEFMHGFKVNSKYVIDNIDKMSKFPKLKPHKGVYSIKIVILFYSFICAIISTFPFLYLTLRRKESLISGRIFSSLIMFFILGMLFIIVFGLLSRIDESFLSRILLCIYFMLALTIVVINHIRAKFNDNELNLCWYVGVLLLLIFGFIFSLKLKKFQQKEISSLFSRFANGEDISDLNIYSIYLLENLRKLISRNIEYREKLEDLDKNIYEYIYKKNSSPSGILADVDHSSRLKSKER